MQKTHLRTGTPCIGQLLLAVVSVATHVEFDFISTTENIKLAVAELQVYDSSVGADRGTTVNTVRSAFQFHVSRAADEAAVGKTSILVGRTILSIVDTLP
ncbi:unnamed protein product [Gongylonema pulchrum]|uniref:SEA domain-containing protein n=1 Tax=Gongylonema pulchrum TaxID=637853 RepID=A0A183EBD4_9BILA|nr:unnamed protein product [Gongylonema pulchrum]